MTKKVNKYLASLYFIVKLISLSISSGTFLFSCTATGFLKEGESFYTGADIQMSVQGNVRGVRSVRKKLETVVTPKPNTVFLGSRPGVWIYYAMGTPRKEKGLRNGIRRKLGEEPVLLKNVTPDRMSKILQGNLFNDGFFDSRVSSSVVTKKKKSSVVYAVDLFPPFVIRNIQYPLRNDSMFQSIIENVEEKSLVKPGQRYSLSMLKAEQVRIKTFLEDEGFYYFDDRYLLFKADSTVGNREVDLDLTLVPGIPLNAKRQYLMRSVDIVNDYTLSADSLRQKRDTVHLDGFNYVHKEGSFRPNVITRVINLRRGLKYSRTAHNYTISHLMGLGTFKFVNIKYRESAAESSSLDATIYLTPLLKKSIRMEAQMVSKSNNFVGPGVIVTFTNRNFLRGAERFQLKLNTSYEAQISSQSGPLNALEVGLEAGLTVPRIIAPFSVRYYSRKYIPNTNFKLGYNFQRRIGFYQLNSFTAGYGYTWRETTEKSHELFPVEINFVLISNKSAQFNEILNDNPAIANSFQNQFIPAMRYSFTYNTQLRDLGVRANEFRPGRNDFYFNGTASLAGNLINLVQRSTSSSEETLQLFGQPYSQFVLGDVDIRYYNQINKHSRLATRILIGSGYAFGNSLQLPYIKQFSSGGSNSIRGFPARSLGPGTYNIRDEVDLRTYFIDQRGDIKLEANAEYRFDIIKTFKGALFVDAGNIWMWREDERAGGKFNTETFLKELAVATGFGLRLDFNFFVLRFDLGFPIRKPYLPDGERWVFNTIDFGSSTWRKENLVFNIAIGYPF